MKSLQLKIMLIVSALILVSEIALGYNMYKASSLLLVDSVGKQAQSIADYAVGQIDPEAYGRITAEGGETAYYDELRGTLNALREANRLKYLYTMNVRDNAGTPEYFYVVDGAPADAAPEDVSALGEPEDGVNAQLEAAFATGEAQIGSLTTEDDYGTTLTSYVPIKDAGGRMLGVLGADFDATDIRAQMNENRSRALWVAGLVLALSLTVVYFVSRMIVAPLTRLTREMRGVESGDLTTAPSDTRRDEIGRLSAAFRSMLGTMSGMIVGVRAGTRDTRRSAEALSGTAERWAEAGADMASHLGEAGERMREQARLSEENSRALGEVNGGIQQIADALSVVAGSARDASDTARTGSGFVRSALERMESVQASSNETQIRVERLNGHSERIGQIVGDIQNISSQTNLLALNASIEAARAGEHGRGFAVVADEVRKLAEQTARSAADVAVIVAGIVGETREAVEGVRVQADKIDEASGVVKRTGDSFDGILSSVERIAERLLEVSAVSQQTAAGAQQATSAAELMEQASRRTAENFAGIERSAEGQAAAIDRMRGSAAELQGMAAELERMVDRFKVGEPDRAL